ncbi:histidinol dehydrogenase [Anaerofustis stercorihominis]|uniref:histidinol dehydrogenase n=1 Tax=Anaerofustis stercorihominis TaxID=214853 RepID=UPI00214B19D6|nr:histidinol dehydrogenase [Anaerofustis stercorihominis]MCR2032050.1 histidinol dehydrogenase [Anaerofustis stercorihominis]
MQIVDLRNEKNVLEVVKEKLQRHGNKLNEVEALVENIIEDVKENKDKALIRMMKDFDKVEVKSIKVDKDEIEKAYESADKDFLEVLKESKDNIEKYHKNQKYSHFDMDEGSKRLTQKVTSIERVGLYIPGGKSPYPSTVLMNAVPAKVAGVKEIALITPPNKEGKVNENILAAAYLCGVDEIYLSGGAGAIAALAYGTETIKPVYKVCGPGNLFVAEAKRKVYGDVDIDMLAGPSEVLVIADEKANPKFVAADLLSQAEHDENAACILVTTSEDLACKVKEEVNIQLKELSKVDIATQSVENYGLIFVVDNIDEAFDVSNEIAPEHLELSLEDPFDYIDKVQNAGTVFMGEYTPEPVGDYFAGSNHTIPTSGKAKFYSPLSTYDFLKRTSIVYYSKEELTKHKDKIIKFANKEGLTAHAKAIERRFE